MNDRVDRLRERLEEPLLVSDAANVLYLSGLESSNAALLVEPERVRVFTDFRYAEAARAIDGVEFVEAKRDLFQTLSEILDGTIGFEATSLTYERHARLHAGGIDLVPRYGLVEELRAVKDEDELDSIRRAGAIVNIAFERFADEGDFVGHTERELAWRFEQFLHEANADGVSFPVHVASGPNAAKPHANPGERRVEEGETVIVDAGCVVDGYCSDCTRTFATGAAAGRAAARVRRLPRRAACGPRRGSARRVRAGCRLGRARPDRGGRLRRGVRARPRARRRASSCTRIRAWRRSPAARSSRRERGHGRAGHLPLGPRRDPDRGSRRRHGRRARDADPVPQGTCALSTRFHAMAETVNTNQFKNGMHIEIDGGVWRIVEFQHVKPGKGGAFVRTKVKNLDTGAVVDRTFRAGEKFQRMHTEVKNAQYLYDSGDDVVFMEDETYEQFSLPRNSVAEELEFIPPSTSVQILTVDGKPSGLQLPSSIELAVAETEPGVKGDTVSNVTKPATLETGATCRCRSS